MDPTLDLLTELDPQDTRPASQQIADRLRDVIIAGELAPAGKLPSQHDLASHYGVARETVKAALRILVREQLVVSRQGSGAYVRDPVEGGAVDDELQGLKAELAALRDQLRRSDADMRRVEKRISGVLDQLESHATREPASHSPDHEAEVHP